MRTVHWYLIKVSRTIPLERREMRAPYRPRAGPASPQWHPRSCQIQDLSWTFRKTLYGLHTYPRSYVLTNGNNSCMMVYSVIPPNKNCYIICLSGVGPSQYIDIILDMVFDMQQFIYQIISSHDQIHQLIKLHIRLHQRWINVSNYMIKICSVVIK